MQNIVICISAFLILTPVIFSQTVVPEYEVKMFIDSSKVLESSSMKLLPEVATYFAITSQYTMGMQFLDSKERDLNSQGWNVRIRSKSKETELEISYKYRIPVIADIPQALEKAKKLGWDGSDVSYEYQIDWGYAKQTLSITNEAIQEDISTLPTHEAARKYGQSYIPEKLREWGQKYLGIENWAYTIIEQAHVYGDVNGIRYTGKISLPNIGNCKVYVEVWDIAGIYVTEVSIKTKEYAKAQQIHASLQEKLRNQGFLVETDILKTQMILDAYGK